MLPPTTYLPPIKLIATYPVDTLENALWYLRLIYSPPVRGSRRRTESATVKLKWREDQLAAEELRNDTFERAYATKWLSALISQCGGEEEDEDEFGSGAVGSEAADCIDDTCIPGPSTPTRRASLIENAASLLATCAGTASAGVITRQFLFDVPGALPISIELTDVPLNNQDYGSVGAQTWGGACIMAEMVAEDPETFGLPGPAHERERLPILRCLELGAGTGLVSLVVSKIIERLGSASKKHVPIHILATDYYPSVLQNLERNVLSNFPEQNPDSKRIILTSRLDWSTFCEVEEKEAVFQEPFDVIYGADIVYEVLHATWIKACLAKLLRKPISPADDPTFHLIIPLRSTHAIESSTIEQVFPTHHTERDTSDPHDPELVIKHKEIIVCDAGNGKHGEEVEYAYYRIGWGWS